MKEKMDCFLLSSFKEAISTEGGPKTFATRDSAFVRPHESFLLILESENVLLLNMLPQSGVAESRDIYLFIYFTHQVTIYKRKKSNINKIIEQSHAKKADSAKVNAEALI